MNQGERPNSAWPALDWEDQTWDPAPSMLTTRRDMSLIGRRYRSAVSPAIAGVNPTLSSGIIADVDEATTEMARFDAQHSVGPILAVLLRSESASSSQIEQITASAGAIAEAEVTGAASGNAAEVAANVQAMEQALRGAAVITVSSIEQIQRVLLQRTHPRLCGWRDDPVWIGTGSSTPLTAEFVPPAAERIPAAMADLVRFIDRNDLPPLIQAAIAHAQFETIHPFADGNGRTGRVLVHLILREKGLTKAATLPISGGLLVTKASYFEALTKYREGNVEPIVEQFARSALFAVRQARSYVDAVDSITTSWRRQLKARADSTVWTVLAQLPATPVFDVNSMAATLGVNPQNIYRSVRTLEEAGIIKGKVHYKSRRFLYRVPEILALLDNFAEGMGRRQS